MPLLDHDISVGDYEVAISAVEKAKNHAQDTNLQRYSGKLYASATQLSMSGRMFSMMISNLNEYVDE